MIHMTIMQVLFARVKKWAFEKFSTITCKTIFMSA
uniref:Uncharacterized protein n=1 Tax=Siphoviridae sp. ctvph17 TaxID=2825724 RepID=A0A8S5UJI1_9CAUD|nr:MAG TPA: hypothetical protein [Siphoviridae sp. ctvph17]